jgi:hypothetical protein
LNKKGKMARPRSSGADRPPRFQREREGERFFPPPLFPEEFPDLFPWMDEAPPLYSPRRQWEPAWDFHFRGLWEMEIPPPDDEWEAFFDWEGEEAGEGRRRRSAPESDGEKRWFGSGNPSSRKKSPVRQMESVEKLSPSFDETEVLDKIRTRSRLDGRSAKG